MARKIDAVLKLQRMAVHDPLMGSLDLMHVADIRPVERLEIVLVAPEDGVVLVKAVEQRQQAAGRQLCRAAGSVGELAKVDLSQNR